MNKSYRTVWNEALGAWVAASEITKARGKRSRSGVVMTAAMVLALSGGGDAAAQTTYSGACVGRPGATSQVDNVDVAYSLNTAIGCASNAGSGASNVAIGGAIADARNADGTPSANGDQVAIGYQAVATGVDSIAIGGQTNALSSNSIALGGSNGGGVNDTRSEGAIAIGASADVRAATTGSSQGAISLGRRSEVNNSQGAIALGLGAIVGAWDSTTGIFSKSSNDGTAIGSSSSVMGSAGGTAVGARASVTDSVGGTALGVSASATNATAGIALGNSATVSADNTVALGFSATATEDGGTALGERAVVMALAGTAVGGQASVTAQRGTAIGMFASVTGEEAVALGSSSLASGFGAIAIGGANNLPGTQGRRRTAPASRTWHPASPAPTRST